MIFHRQYSVLRQVDAIIFVLVLTLISDIAIPIAYKLRNEQSTYWKVSFFELLALKLARLDRVV